MDKDILILYDDGKVVMAIDKFDTNWKSTAAAKGQEYDYLDYELIGDSFLKVNDINPYIIDLETLKAFKD